MTSLEAFIENYQFISYLIIFIGVLCIEADLFFLTAAIFAEQGYLSWIILMPMSYIAITLGDIGFYYIGIYSKKIKLGIWVTKKFSRLHNWMDNNFMPSYYKVIYFGKFVSGISRFLPFLAGLHKMPIKKFLKIHLTTSVFWLLTVTAIGLFLGNIVTLIGPKEIFRRIWIVFLTIGAIIFVSDYILKKKLSKKLEKKTA